MKRIIGSILILLTAITSIQFGSFYITDTIRIFVNLALAVVGLAFIFSNKEVEESPKEEEVEEEVEGGDEDGE